MHEENLRRAHLLKSYEQSSRATIFHVAVQLRQKVSHLPRPLFPAICASLCPRLWIFIKYLQVPHSTQERLWSQFWLDKTNQRATPLQPSDWCTSVLVPQCCNDLQEAARIESQKNNISACPAKWRHLFWRDTEPASEISHQHLIPKITENMH